MTSPRDYLATPEQMGGGFLRALANAPNQLEEMKKAIYANQMAKAQAQYAPQNALSEMLRNQYLIQEEGVKSQYAPQMTEADLKNKIAESILRRAQAGQANAQANYYSMGGGSGGVDAGLINAMINNTKKDYPNLSQDQARDAVNNLISGGNTFSNGQPLPEAKGIVKRLLDSSFKHSTTAPLITQGVKSNQAQAELDVLDREAQKDLAPYGDTILGYSPKQIMDTFSNDPEDQKRLGRLIASQALQFEIAQNRSRLANGPVGTKSTEELMERSKQLIKDKWPKLSEAARAESARRMDEALGMGLAARQSVGVSPTQLSPGAVAEQFSNKKSQNTPEDKIANALQSKQGNEEGVVVLNGKKHKKINGKWVEL